MITICRVLLEEFDLLRLDRNEQRRIRLFDL